LEKGHEVMRELADLTVRPGGLATGHEAGAGRTEPDSIVPRCCSACTRPEAVDDPC
jgi:hypothetical protein